jgi:hypothetical protein
VAYYPAPPPYAYRPPCPGPGYNWVSGYWYRSGPRNVWRNGYWAAPRVSRGWRGGSYVPYNSWRGGKSYRGRDRDDRRRYRR